MRRFFTILFIISILATAGVYYWRTYQPEETVAVNASRAPSASVRDWNGGGGGVAPNSFARERSARQFVQEPSQRQDLAMIISVASSVISALAAIFQTWLATKAVRNRA